MSVITIATTKGGAGKTTLARLILGRTALWGELYRQTLARKGRLVRPSARQGRR